MLGCFVRVAPVNGLIVGRGRGHLLERFGELYEVCPQGTEPVPASGFLIALSQDLGCLF